MKATLNGGFFAPMQFIPFNQIKEHQQVVAVDSFHPQALALSHWKGAPKPAGVPAGDTSTDWVLNTLRYKPELLKGYPYATNNHFDIDGFLGIWALQNPELALTHETTLRHMALIGDFRELYFDGELDTLALKLCCWLNKEEERFYLPFASYNPKSESFKGKSEAAWCVDKYLHFLPRFAQMLKKPEACKALWQPEYEKVMQDMHLIEEKGKRLEFKNIRLQLVKSPEPVHYYALFAQSAKADAVLSMYSHNRYELEYKYTGWVDTERRVYPRLNLKVLAEQLNSLEKSPYTWQAEGITDTGPILRLTDHPLTKEERYASPYTRNILSSSISAEEFLQLVIDFFNLNLKGIQPKTNWSWQEQKQMTMHNLC